MVKRTGPTNQYLKELVRNLKKKSLELNAPIWKTVAEKLDKPTRNKVEVNVSKIERFANKGETVVVPGTVLAAGQLSKPVNVSAWRFSAGSIEKIKKANGKILTIEELVQENPKGSNIKILM